MDGGKYDDLFGGLNNETKKTDHHNMFKTNRAKDFKRKRDDVTEAIRKRTREERFKNKRMGEDKETPDTKGKLLNRLK